MTSPLVSIIIPVYNTGTSATKLITTLLNSSYQNLEIIAIDDGSTDDSLKFLRAIKDPITKNSATLSSKQSSSSAQQLVALHRGRNSRLRVLHQKNSGASSARNLGIKHATGRYIAFFDSDDTVNPQIITQFVRAFEQPHLDSSSSPRPSHSVQSPVVLATCAYRYHRVRQGTTEDIYTTPPVLPQPGDTFKAYILRLLLSDGRLYAVINKLFRADIIQRHQLEFDTSLNFAEDTKFVLEYLNYAYHDIILPEYLQKIAPNLAKNSSGDIKSNYSPDDIFVSDYPWQEFFAFIPKPLYHYNYGTVTSTVVSSSLPWQNWQTSYDNLVAWLNTNPATNSAKSSSVASSSLTAPTDRELQLLRQVRTRWRISHALAVARANLPLKEKRRYLSLPKLLLAKIALIFRK